MSSIIKVDTVQDQDGNNIINENADVITVGASGDTITIPAGATFDSSAATNTLPATVVTTTGTQTLTNKSIAATQLTGTVATSNLGTGTADSTTFLRGDQTYAAAGGGKVLQVVTATDSTARSTTSTSFVTASNTLSLNITPSATSSKIYLIATFTGYGNTSGKSTYLTFYRDSTNLGNVTSGLINTYDTNSTRIIGKPMAMSILDSPNSTSEITYQVYIKAESGGQTIINYDNNQGSITAFEVGA